MPFTKLTTSAITGDTLTAGDLASNSVDSAELVDGSIDLAHMSSESVDEDNLHISNAGTNGQFLSKQSGNSGGLTWADAGGTFVETGSYYTIGVATTSISINDCFTSDYDIYMIQVNALPASNGEYFGMRCMDGGTNHDDSVYAYANRYFDEQGAESSNTAQTGTFFKLADAVNSREYDGGCQYTIWCYLNRDRTDSQSFRYTLNGGFNHNNSSGRIHTTYGAGGMETSESTDNVTGIGFFFGSGNIENLHLKVWGLSGTNSA